MRRPPLSAVILAAGQGTRMMSERPKPLHVLAGRPMLLHIVDALRELPLDRIVVVVGHGAESVTKTLQEHAPPDVTVDVVEQEVTRGTGDAVAVALTAIPDDDDEASILVLPSDVPLVRSSTLDALRDAHRFEDAAATVLTARLAEPTGYSRVVRNKNGLIEYLVDHVDAGPSERTIDEVCTSVYMFRRSLLAPALRRLTPETTLGEYYLSDVIAVLHDAGYGVHAFEAPDPTEIAGVNDRVQLALAEAELRRRTNLAWLREGVTMLDPDRTYIDASVELAPDVTLFPGTMLQGHTVVGRHARIGPDTRLVDCVVGENAIVEHTVARDAEIGPGAVVGPFASLSPGAQIPPGARTGPFYTAATGD